MMFPLSTLALTDSIMIVHASGFSGRWREVWGSVSIPMMKLNVILVFVVL